MNRVLSRTRNSFLGATVGVAAFAAVYELFSHQVYSHFLIFAFLIPLFGGVLPYSLLSGSQRSKKPGILAQCLYNSGLATLTAGSIFQGILEIYGTTSHLSIVYWTIGFSLSILGLIAYVAAANQFFKSNPSFYPKVP
jgi:hypothetical protein